MSIFLLYFEKNNPDVPWTEFQKKWESITETFTKSNDRESLLRIVSVNILLDSKVISAFIIHDGVSSDRILQTNLKDDPIVSKQRFVLLNFLENRLSIRALDHYLIFHLYHKSIHEVVTVNYNTVVETRLSDLMGLPNIRKDVLHKLLS